MPPRKRTPDEEIPHGTYPGWNMHMQRGIPMDDECRAAASAWHAEHRRTHPEVRRRDYLKSKARARALSRLQQKHGAEYMRLLAEETAKIKAEEASS